MNDNDINTSLMQAMLATKSDATKLQALRILKDEPIPQPLQLTPERYLSLKKTAEHLSMHPCTLWRAKVPGHKLGSRKRYLLSEVIAHLQK